ncbi:MAG: TonB family protein, partial [Ancylomarina sp.]
MIYSLYKYMSGIILIISLNFIGLHLNAQNIAQYTVAKEVDSIQVKINSGNLIIQTIPTDVVVEIPKLQINEKKKQDSLILENIYSGVYDLSFEYNGHDFKCFVEVLGRKTVHVLVDVKAKKLETRVIDYKAKIKELEPVTDDQVFIMVEEMPEFPGGILELRKWVKSNVKYPEIAREKKIIGKVYIGFVINEYGKVEGGKVLRSIDPLLDREALRVVNSMPNWKPGKQKGKPVKVSFS